jgi:hypothetical protein
MYRTFVIWLVATGAIVAADPIGTEPGQVLPGPFPAYIVAAGSKPAPPVNEKTQTEERLNFGDPTRAGKFHDLITRFGLDPTVAIFIREAPPAEDSPLAQLLKSLDAQIRANRNARLHAFAVFLRLKDDFLKDDSRIPQIKAIDQFANKLGLKELPVAIDLAESDRTRAYKLGADATVTIILYEKLKVRSKFVFTADKPLDEAAVKNILDEVKKLVKP